MTFIILRKFDSNVMENLIGIRYRMRKERDESVNLVLLDSKV